VVPGAVIGELRGLAQIILGSRWTASRCLAARGLARPRILWAEIETIKR
jgi:hypothetical protein